MVVYKKGYRKRGYSVARFEGGLNIALNKDTRGGYFASAYRDKGSRVSDDHVFHIENNIYPHPRTQSELVRRVTLITGKKPKSKKYWDRFTY
jgi:hypothetical protein